MNPDWQLNIYVVLYGAQNIIYNPSEMYCRSDKWKKWILSRRFEATSAATYHLSNGLIFFWFPDNLSHIDPISMYLTDTNNTIWCTVMKKIVISSGQNSSLLGNKCRVLASVRKVGRIYSGMWARKRIQAGEVRVGKIGADRSRGIDGRGEGREVLLAGEGWRGKTKN